MPSPNRISGDLICISGKLHNKSRHEKLILNGASPIKLNQRTFACNKKLANTND